MLQPDLAARHRRAARGQHQREDRIHRIAGRARRVDRARCEHQQQTEIEAALYQAQRAGILIVEILQIKPAREQQRAGGGGKGKQGARGDGHGVLERIFAEMFSRNKKARFPGLFWRNESRCYSGLMFEACRPFGPLRTSNSTFWFSLSDL